MYSSKVAWLSKDSKFDSWEWKYPPQKKWEFAIVWSSSFNFIVFPNILGVFSWHLFLASFFSQFIFELDFVQPFQGFYPLFSGVLYTQHVFFDKDSLYYTFSRPPKKNNTSPDVSQNRWSHQSASGIEMKTWDSQRLRWIKLLIFKKRDTHHPAPPKFNQGWFQGNPL